MRRLLAVVLLLISPAMFAAGRELAPRGIGPTPFYPSIERTAWVNGEFVTTWTENMGAIGTVRRAARSDANGHRIGDLPVADAPVPPDAWNGTYSLRTEHIFSPPRSEATLIDQNGVVRHRLAIDAGASEFQITPFAGGFLVLASSRTNGFVAHRIGNDGSVVTRTIAESGAFVSTQDPDGRLFVVWSSASGVHSAILTTDAELLDPRKLDFTGAPVVLPVHLMRVDDGHLLLYHTPSGNRFTLASVKIAPDGSTSGAVTYPVAGADTIRSAASNGRTILVAWTSAPPEFQIYSMAIAADGSASAPELLSFGPAAHTPPVITSTNAGVLAAWSTYNGRTPSFSAADMNAGAAPRTAPMLLAARELAWNGEQALTLVLDGTSLAAVRLDAQGNILGKTSVVQEPNLYRGYEDITAATWVGDRWMVLLGYQPLRFATVTTSGVVSELRKLPIEMKGPANWLGVVVSTAAVWDGEHVVLAWTEEYTHCDGPRCFESLAYTRIVRLTREGDVIDTTPLEVYPAETISLATSGSEAVLLAGTMAHVIDTHGATLREISTTPVLNWSGQGDITWDGSEYVIALRYVGAHWYTSLSRFDRALHATAPMRAIATRAPDVIAGPSVAMLAPRNAVIALNEGDSEHGVAAVLYTETEMPEAPARPRAPQQVYSRIASSSTYEITWHTSDDAELYRVEGSYGDIPGWEHVATLTPDQLPRVISHYPLNRVIAFNAGGASEPAGAGAPPPAPPRRRTARP